MLRLTAFLLALVTLVPLARADAPRLEDTFARPPDDAKPWVFWFWADGNLTREGITADLEAMQRVGLGGAIIMEVDQDVPKGPIRFMSPAWRELFAFATTEAARLGLELNLNNDAGWTGSGGPWNDAAHSMQRVVWSETTLTGPVRFDDAISAPEANAGHYRDITLLAFPTPPAETRSMRREQLTVTAAGLADPALAARATDGDRSTGFDLAAGTAARPAAVQLDFAEPFTARTLDLALSVAGGRRVLIDLQVSPDGVAWHPVARLASGGAMPLRFEAVCGRRFRLHVAAAADDSATVRINEIVLSPAYRIDNHKAKSGLGLTASPELVSWEGEGVAIGRATVIDLSDRLRDGRLAWDVPPGEWTLLRLGHTTTGKTNHPAPAEGTGFEVDKLSRAAVDGHFDAFAERLLGDRTPGQAGAVTAVHVDSWEVGYQNWTPGFETEFRERRGYDPLPWLPALSGRVVESAEASERFLWDLRRTVSELVRDNYAGRMAERAHAAGRIFSLEGYRYGPFDCLATTGRADLPVAEFWTTRDPANLHPSVKTVASAAHSYGRPVVAAEAFTASDLQGRQRHHPFSLKAIGDAAFCAGINQFIIHRYAMQPWTDDRVPGMTMGPWGVEYERTATWWEQSRPWHDYLARCQHLLRQGTFVADLCYLQSEEGYNNPALPVEVRPAVPEGYDYDFVSDEVVLERMTVRDGLLVLPDGMSYRVLVLPQQRLMRPALLRKIHELVRAGATVHGLPPLRSPSLEGYPTCDDEVRELTAELWSDCGCDDDPLERAVGRGQVRWGPSLADTLVSTGAEPDFLYRNSNDTADAPRPTVRFIHRALPDRDIYFVANLGDAPASIVASLRTAKGAPTLWHPDSGAIEPVPVFDQTERRTRLPLRLDARGSVFVVLRHADAVDPHHAVSLRRGDAVLGETGPVEPLPVAPQPETRWTEALSTFTLAAWVRPAAEMVLPPEDFAGTRAYSIRRNDLLFAPPVHDVLGRIEEAGIGLAVGRNGVAVCEHGDHHFPATLVHPVRLEAWTHVAVVYDQGRPTLYLDGKAVRTGLKTLLKVRSGLGVAHGRDIAPFAGEHSALRQVDRALTPAEVVELMQATPVEPITPPREESGLIASAPDAGLRLERSPSGELVGWATKPGAYAVDLASGRRMVAAVGAEALPEPVPVGGAWVLDFPPDRGAPATVDLPELVSWSEHTDPGARHFSGTAVYRKTFDVPVGLLDPERRCWLDLGQVEVIASVRLNGRDLGVLWRPPFRLDVTEVLRAGANDLEVRVTNLWVNRLIGDEALPADREWRVVPRRGGRALAAYPDWFERGERSPAGRITFATWKHYEASDPLLPSGLLGPVRLVPEQRIEWEEQP